MTKRALLTLSIALTFPTISSAACADFSRTLREGSYGSDVKALQRVLNQDAVTRVAKNGPGSPGNEISNFGHATTLALMRFQERYRSAILTPAGKKNPDGVAGSLTRKKLAELSCPPANTSTTVSTSKTPAKSSAVTIEAPANYQVRIGDSITIRGTGLASSNTVNFGGTSVNNVSASNNELNLLVPDSSPLGVVKITVTNKNGTSNGVELFVGRAGKSTAGAGGACLDITRTLKIGTTGNDILLLTRFLNTDARTSIGFESLDYTPVVSDAVARFQTLYSSDILVPAKLESPTGITSLFTADKVREITCGSKKLTPEQKAEAAKVIATPGTSTKFAQYQKNFAAKKAASDQALASLTKKSNDYVDAINATESLPKLYTAHMRTAGTGSTLTLSGRNFTVNTNDIYLCGKLAFSGVTSDDDGSIVYQFNANVDSTCSVSVKNENGSSNSIALVATQTIDPALINSLLSSSTQSEADIANLQRSLGF